MKIPLIMKCILPFSIETFKYVIEVRSERGKRQREEIEGRERGKGEGKERGGRERWKGDGEGRGVGVVVESVDVQL